MSFFAGIMNPMTQRTKAGNLRRLRHGWEEVEAVETRLLRQLTIEQSLCELVSLQRAFELRLQRTETPVRAES